MCTVDTYSDQKYGWLDAARSDSERAGIVFRLESVHMLKVGMNAFCGIPHMG